MTSLNVLTGIVQTRRHSILYTGPDEGPFLLPERRNSSGKEAGMAEKKLTVKQKKFVDFYVETGNATESAIRAGPLP